MKKEADKPFFSLSLFFKDWKNVLQTFDKMKKEAANPFFNSKYLDLPKVLAEVKRVCFENNFVFTQTPDIKDGKPVLKTTIIHEIGEKIEGIYPIIAKDDTDPQKVGGGLTYARRYSLTCMFGIEEEDDDGNTASKPKTASKAVENTKEKPKAVGELKPLPASDKQLSMIQYQIFDSGDNDNIKNVLKLPRNNEKYPNKEADYSKVIFNDVIKEKVDMPTASSLIKFLLEKKSKEAVDILVKIGVPFFTKNDMIKPEDELSAGKQKMEETIAAAKMKAGGADKLKV